MIDLIIRNNLSVFIQVVKKIGYLIITCNSSHSIFIMKSVKFVERSKEMKNIETYSHSYYDHWNSKENIFAKDIIKNFIFQ